MFILPLSLENNATTTGTAAILTEYANSFHIPCTDSKTFFPFNEETKQFDVKKSREHFEFQRMIQDHIDEMADFERLLTETEKQLDTDASVNTADDTNDLTAEQLDQLFEDFDFENEEKEEDILNLESLGDNVPTSTLKSKKEKFQKEDRLFTQTYDNLMNKAWKQRED